ncbi:alpha-hydroxy acid oxidase [Allohahella marinimesophila]|uniref:Alpha-hydroxy acid oxidase n=1 Tax=Allohahella marinimesophila TaxID=1054972 RepID=A0ABP7NN19_9GAMM
MSNQQNEQFCIPRDVVSLGDYERVASTRLTHACKEHIAAGVGDELTLQRNREDFDRIRIQPRLLRNFAQANTSCELLGSRLRHPIMLAPVAYQKLVHVDGELATAAGAAAVDCGMIVSTLASASLEDIANQGLSLLWFQVYFQPERAATLALVRRAERAGYTALVVTLDAPVSGLRNRAQRAGFELPEHVTAVNLEHFSRPPQRALDSNDSVVLHGFMADAPTMADLTWLLAETRLPVLVKGVLNPLDALELKNLGCAGVVVSNHGGRTLDGLPSTISALAAVRAAVGDEYPVLLDSGIRRGTDVLKALALGANCVLVGRPQLYALAVAGALGVAHMLRLLHTEFETAMALSGCPSLADITKDCILAD